VLYVAELTPSAPDEKVLSEASEADSPLITADMDFGELVYRQGRARSGVVLLGLAGLPESLRLVLVVRAIADHGMEMGGAFTVVTPGPKRIRRCGRRPGPQTVCVRRHTGFNAGGGLRA
jgi:hypothetical protein